MAEQRICAVDGCGKPHNCKGFCRKHYIRYKKHGDPLALLKREMGTTHCTVNGCDGKHVAHGLCRTHYSRQYSQGQCSVSGCDGIAKASGYCLKHNTRMVRHNDLLYSSKAEAGEPERWIVEHAKYDEDGCLIWPFARNPCGYGKTTYRGVGMGAHRAMCIEVNGPPPSDIHEAAHSCGNGHLGCVNQKHLRWATPQENALDRVKHGTSGRGEDHPHAKLTVSDVYMIRALHGSVPQKRIAEKFGVSTSTISAVQRRIRWGWL